MAAGTKIGTGHVAIEPDFTGFQDAVERAIISRFPAIGDRAGRGLSDGIRKRVRRDRDAFGLAGALAAVVQRFGKTGEDAGRQFGRGVSKGARQSGGDMFGLAGALDKVEKNAGSVGRAMASLERDMFGVGRAAKAAGRHIVGTRLGDFRRDAQSTDRATRGLGARLRGLVGDLTSVASRTRAAAAGFGGMNGAMARVNRGAQFFRNITRLLRIPALIAGLGLATQGLSALAAGLVATAASVGPLAGALVALPAAVGVATQAFAALKLATAGVGDTIKAALDAQVKGGGQAVDTMRAQKAATDRVTDAQRSLQEAERQSKFTREALTAATAEARREYEDLKLAVEGLPQLEEEAALRLKELRRELQRTATDSESSELDIRFAENAVDQAENDLKRIRLDARRTRQDYEKVVDSGVRRMPQVVEARRAHADAIRAEQDAQRDLQQALEDNAAAMREQGAAATTLNDQMGKLPVAAQQFVRELVSMKPRLDQLRATAASGLFPGVTAGLRGLMGNFGEINTIIGETARAFGGLAERAGQRLGSAEWGRDLLKIGRQNNRSLNQAGEAGLNFADALRHVLVAARPFVNWLGKGVVRLSDWVKTEAEAGRKSGRLAAFFDRTKRTMQLLAPILKGVGGGFLNIGKAARPLGNSILRALGGAAEGWRKWSGSVEGQNTLREYFADAKPAIFEMGRLLRDTAKAFFQLGNQPGAANLIKQVRTELLPALVELVGTLTGAFGKALVSSLTSVVKLLSELSHETGPLVAFVKVIGGVADGLAAVIDWVPGMRQIVVGVIALGAALRAAKLASAVLGFTSLARAAVAAAAASRMLAAGQGLVATATKRGTAATLVAKAAMFASAGAAKAWAAAQRILNFALTNNPIGRVITIVALLGGALVTAYKKSETFRNIVNGALGAVRDGAVFLADRWLGLVTTMLGGMSSIARGASRLPFVGGKFDGVADAIDNVRDKIDGWRESMRGGNSDGQNTKGLKAQQAEVDRLRNKLSGLRKGTKEYRDAAEKLRSKQRDLNKALDDTKPAAGRASRGLDVLRANAGGVGRSLGSIAEYAQTELNKVLREFGADPIKHKVKPFPKLVPIQQLRRQRGGPINMGAPTGDSVPALLERDEYVLNRNAVKKIGRRALDAINFGIAPRFQKGGAVGDIGGLSAGALKLAAVLGNRFGMIVSSGRRAGDDGLHGQGDAIDVVGGDWRGASRYLNRIGPQLLEGIYNPAVFGGQPVSWDSGQNVSPGFWGGKWANHLDHMHAAVGSAFKAVATRIRRLLITGGTDTTRRLLQGAADRLVKGANAHIRTAMPRVSHGNLGDLSNAPGEGDDLMKAISRQRGWKFGDWWELDRRETGHGADTYNESSGASLRAQFLPMNFGRYGPGSDPGRNPSMREQIISMARYIAERYGNPSAALAHHNRHNWYQLGGLVERFQGGGLVGMASKRKPKRKPKKGGPELIDVSKTAIGSAAKAIQQSMRLVRNPGAKPRVRSTQVKRLVKRLKAEFELPKGWREALLQFEAKEALTLDRAQRADDQTFDVVDADGEPVVDAEGRQVVSLGRMDGRTAEDWTRQRLLNLIAWRNKLIEARVKVIELVKQLEQHIEAQKRKVKQLTAEIDRKFKLKGHLEDLIGYVRRPPKLNAKKITTVLKKVKKLVPDEMYKRISDAVGNRNRPWLKDRLENVTDSWHADRQVRTKLAGKVIPALVGRRDTLSSDRTGFEDQLATIQGPGYGMDLKDLFDGWPRLGQFSGNIFEAHQDLNRFSEKPPFVKRDTDTDDSRNLDRELFNQQYGIEALEELQRQITAGAQRLVPFGGIFHEGGVVPGPPGAERMILARAGERVLTEDQQITEPPVLYAEIKIGDEVIDRKIVKVIDARERADRGQFRAGIAP
jgi:predicted  nucleic acid-binding Zn-ribbon protein